MSSSASTSKPETIVVGRRREPGVPYSRYLMSQSLSASGLSPERAYELARTVGLRLEQREQRVIGVGDLRALAEQVLLAEEGERAVERFGAWQRLDSLDRPLIVMLSGTTGVGKSTLATMLAHRLGITRVIATDVIRHVLRSFFARELMPAVHYSAFDAAGAVDDEVSHGDRDLVGYERQAESIGHGVAAIVDRACTEGTAMVVEGVHLLPDGLPGGLAERCVLVEALLVVDDEQLHRGHFALRGGERPAERYLSRFEEIRKLQRHLAARAGARGVATIDNYSIDAALAETMDLVLRTVGRL